MSTVPVHVTSTVRRQKAVLPHQPQHAVLAHSVVSSSKTCPYLTMSFTQKWARSKHLSDRLQKLVVAPPGTRTSYLHRPLRDPLGCQPRIHGRTWHPIRFTHQRHRVDPATRRAHPRPGFNNFLSSSPYPLFSSRPSTSSSFIIVSPSLARVRVSSFSTGSPLLRFKP